jgi:hypothetical protein
MGAAHSRLLSRRATDSQLRTSAGGRLCQQSALLPARRSSAGYDIAPRIKTITLIYTAQDKTAACLPLAQNDIDYVMISASERNGSHFKLNEALFKNQFKLAAAIPQASDTFTVYDVKQSCGSAVAVAPG